MGWWKADETGGISSELPSGAVEGGLFNAIPERDKINDTYVGDIPADIMDKALDLIAQEYHDSWGRSPCVEELRRLLEFCLGPYLAIGSYDKSAIKY